MHMHMHTHAHTHTRTRARTRAPSHVYDRTHEHTHTRTSTIARTHAHKRTRTHARAHAPAHTSTRARAQSHTAPHMSRTARLPEGTLAGGARAPGQPAPTWPRRGAPGRVRGQVGPLIILGRLAGAGGPPAVLGFRVWHPSRDGPGCGPPVRLDEGPGDCCTRLIRRPAAAVAARPGARNLKSGPITGSRIPSRTRTRSQVDFESCYTMMTSS
jgi:hypothetical protein